MEGKLSTQQQIIVLLNKKNATLEDFELLLNSIPSEEIKSFKHSNGNNLIHFIAGPNYCNTFFSAVKILSKTGLDVNSKNETGNTPLHILAQYGHSNFIENSNILFELGADVNAVDKELRTPLMNLCSNDDYTDKKTKKKIQIHSLVSHFSNFPQVKFELQDCRGMSAIHYCKSEEVLDILISKGIEIKRKTVFHYACEHLDKKFIRKLIADLKMDPNDAILSTGNTCLHIAVEKRVRWMLANFLLPYGGDVNKKNKEGVSPLELARKINSRSLQLLMEWHLKVEESINNVKKEIHKGEIVFFDLETDKLFQDFSTYEEALGNQKMTVGVLFDGKEYITHFGDKSADIDSLGKKFDEAKKIVIFNHKSDLGILEKYYSQFPGRVQKWREKVLDPYLIILELDGSSCSLGELASVNRLGEKGESKEAPTMWKEGRIEELVAHCRQDVELLLKIVEKGYFLEFLSKEGSKEEKSYQGKIVDLFSRKVSTFADFKE